MYTALLHFHTSICNNDREKYSFPSIFWKDSGNTCSGNMNPYAPDDPVGGLAVQVKFTVANQSKKSLQTNAIHTMWKRPAEQKSQHYFQTSNI